MQKIKKSALIKSINESGEMNLVEAEKVMDEIYLEQPSLFESVLAQKQMGNSMEQIEVLLNILIITHLALRYSGVRIQTVTLEEQEKELTKYAAHLQFIEGLDSKSKGEAIRQYSDNNDEELLMAYVTNKMKEAGFTKNPNKQGKYLVMTGMNIVNCINIAKIA
jgi:polyhydroxyalkanoate synthesis regulator phasin